MSPAFFSMMGKILDAQIDGEKDQHTASEDEEMPDDVGVGDFFFSIKQGA